MLPLTYCYDLGLNTKVACTDFAVSGGIISVYMLHRLYFLNLTLIYLEKSVNPDQRALIRIYITKDKCLRKTLISLCSVARDFIVIAIILSDRKKLATHAWTYYF